jgi:hypothetical protein
VTAAAGDLGLQSLHLGSPYRWRRIVAVGTLLLLLEYPLARLLTWRHDRRSPWT